MQIGHSNRLATEFYQPLAPAQREFGAVHAAAARDPFDVYNDAGPRLSRYRRGSCSLGFDLGAPLRKSAQARPGISPTSWWCAPGASAG